MRARLWFLLLPALLAGSCWDAEEIDRREIIVALGVDAASGGKVMVTSQLPVLENLLPPAISGGSSPQRSYIFTSRAETGYQSASGLQAKSPRDLFSGQVKVIVFSEAIARRGLTPYLDALHRRPEIPPQAFVMLTDGSARDLLDVKLTSLLQPAFALTQFFKTDRDQAFPQALWSLGHHVHGGRNEPEEAFLPIVGYNESEGTFFLRGLGLLHGDRLVGRLSGREARMVGLMTGRSKDLFLNVPVRGLGRVTFRTVKGSSVVKASRSGGTIRFRVAIRAQGYLTEITEPVSPISVKMTDRIARTTAAAIKNETSAMIRHLQKVNSDILGFGELLRSKYPAIWKNTDWETAFPKARVDVDVHFNIDRTGKFR